MFDRADELLKQGTQSEDNRALIEAIDTYRRGPGLLARPESPLQWALAHTIALETLGEWENGTARRGRRGLPRSLEGYTREREPLDWAATQMNLGNALARLGERESGTARLEEAVAAFRDVVKEYTPARAPLDWAAAQMNLGNTLRVLGERESGTARLEEAVEAYREALKEYTREHVPLEWATTQISLGAALETLGERESGTARLEGPSKPIAKPCRS
jgi:tetratricopeptide (TPR) repeat protein